MAPPYEEGCIIDPTAEYSAFKIYSQKKEGGSRRPNKDRLFRAASLFGKSDPAIPQILLDPSGWCGYDLDRTCCEPLPLGIS